MLIIGSILLTNNYFRINSNSVFTAFYFDHTRRMKFNYSRYYS